MLLLLLRLIAVLVHIGLVFAGAPLLMGVTTKIRARLLGRKGPPVWQPYLHLRKLLQKSCVIPDTATELYAIWPYVGFAAIAAAACLIPSFCTGMLGAGGSDFIVFVGLLALARAANVLAGLETGFGFGGAGAARDILCGVFVEAALLVVILTFVLMTGDATIDGIARHFRAGHLGISVSAGFALVAMLAVALSETGRMPVDNPAGHLELAMVHEAMRLEYSGRLLLLFDYATMLRLMVWMCLIGTVFLPYGMADAAAILSWPGGLVLWVVKLLALAAGLAVLEISTAKLRVFMVPEFLGVAMLLGILSAIFLFVAARLGT
jgi:formate hydrogenlyase subunit 4